MTTMTTMTIYTDNSQAIYPVALDSEAYSSLNSLQDEIKREGFHCTGSFLITLLAPPGIPARYRGLGRTMQQQLLESGEPAETVYLCSEGFRRLLNLQQRFHQERWHTNESDIVKLLIMMEAERVKRGVREWVRQREAKGDQIEAEAVRPTKAHNFQ